MTHVFHIHNNHRGSTLFFRLPTDVTNYNISLFLEKTSLQTNTGFCFERHIFSFTDFIQQQQQQIYFLFIFRFFYCRCFYYI